MPLNDKFEKFSNTVIKEATAEKELFVKEIQREFDEYAKSECDKISQEMEKEIKKYKALENQNRTYEIFRRKNKLQMELFKERTRLFDSLITEVKDLINKTFEKEKYLEYLKHNLIDAISNLNQNELQLKTNDRDLPKIKKILMEIENHKKFKFVKDNKLFGGFIIISSKILIDCSIDSKLKDEKLKFSESGNIIIDFDDLS